MLRGVATSRDPAWLARRKPRSQAPLLIDEQTSSALRSERSDLDQQGRTAAQRRATFLRAPPGRHHIS
jgi:hypothetical protein